MFLNNAAAPCAFSHAHAFPFQMTTAAEKCILTTPTAPLLFIKVSPKVSLRPMGGALSQISIEKGTVLTQHKSKRLGLDCDMSCGNGESSSF